MDELNYSDTAETGKQAHPYSLDCAEQEIKAHPYYDPLSSITLLKVISAVIVKSALLKLPAVQQSFL